MLQILQIFDPQALLSFISEVATNVESSVYQVVVELSGNAWDGLDSIWGALAQVWAWLQRILAALWAWIQAAVHWILSTALPAIETFLQKIIGKVRAFLAPLIKLIKAQIQQMQAVYNQLVKPLMNFLQRLRAILVIFRLFHLKFAQVLDQYIVDLETRINTAFLSVESDLGRMEQWLEFFSNPMGVFNPFPFLSAAMLSITQLYAVLANLPAVVLGAGTLAQQQASAQGGLYSSAQATIQSRATGPTATDLQNYANHAADFQKDGYTWVK